MMRMMMVWTLRGTSVLVSGWRFVLANRLHIQIRHHFGTGRVRLRRRLGQFACVIFDNHRALMIGHKWRRLAVMLALDLVLRGCQLVLRHIHVFDLVSDVVQVRLLLVTRVAEQTHVGLGLGQAAVRRGCHHV